RSVSKMPERISMPCCGSIINNYTYMLYFLENDNYKVGIESRGAELQHFIKKDEELELIWQADPQVWASHAPTLFPIIGELPNGSYTYEDETYHMKRHGFARHKEF